MAYMPIIYTTSYLGTLFWCLSVYHRYSKAVMLELYWHFFISVSRTISIAFVASIFPLWTLFACLFHALLFGFVTFFIEKPKFGPKSSCDFTYCLVLGVFYIFNFISVRHVPTRRIYLLYYVFSSLETIICVILLIFYAYNDLRFVAELFYPLCITTLKLYCIGVALMVIIIYWIPPSTHYSPEIETY